MNIYDASEQAYKRGYEAGQRDARKKGRWEWHAALVNPYALCSNCGCGLAKTDALNFYYCPYCGADMRGEEE